MFTGFPDHVCKSLVDALLYQGVYVDAKEASPVTRAGLLLVGYAAVARRGQTVRQGGDGGSRLHRRPEERKGLSWAQAPP